jgi:phosphomannomutase
MLIRSISGVRGLVTSHLTPQVAVEYAKALHKYIPDGVIVAGRDSRPSGDIILELMCEQLVLLGRTIIHCGIVPTPTVQFMVHNTEAVGGFIVTASHNPIEWNGLKFVREDSTFFHPNDCENLFEIVDKNSVTENAQDPGMIWPEKNAIQKHIISCVGLKCISLNRIQKRKFKVVIDSINGAGSQALPLMLQSLGCEVIELNCESDGNFTRGTEPLPENLMTLSQMVKDHSADVGFAIDPDADRLAIVNEKGDPLGEEYTIVLAADGYLTEMNQKEKFVLNLSSSLALDKLAEIRGSSVVRSAVGEINVVNKMNKVNSNLGGEGNGGVILRECHLGRDSLVGVTMILNRMSQSNDPLSVIHQSLPQFIIVKDKVNLEGIDAEDIIKRATKLFKNVEKNTLDGIKFIWKDRWVHLRKSNTEPIIRIYSEASDENQALELINKIKSLI